MESKTHRIIVGIDFGTTFSGLAYVYTGDPKLEVIVVDKWPVKGRFFSDTRKVPTEIAYGATSEDTLWGYQIPPGMARCCNFKLGLQPELLHLRRSPRPPGTSSHVDVEHIEKSQNYTITGDKTPFEATRDFLKLLYGWLMNVVLAKRFPHQLSATQIQFVLTVPALWDERGRLETRRAALEAGIGSREECCDFLQMIKEPEAAALYAFKSLSNLDNLENQSMVLCDAGGGTVDLITYHIKSIRPLGLQEIGIEKGLDCGSAYIDAAYIRLLQRRIKKFAQWDDRFKGRGSKLMDRFLEAKHMFENMPGDSISPLDLGHEVQDDSKNGINAKHMSIQLQLSDMVQLFDRCLEQIKYLLEEQLLGTKGRHVEGIVLAGGFGTSLYLYNELKLWAASNHPKLEILDLGIHSWTAIVQGAVLYGLEKTVKFRKLPRHYGAGIGVPFVESTHDEMHCYTDTLGRKWSTDHIRWFAHKGDDYEEGHRVPIEVNFYTQGQIPIPLYTCAYDVCVDSRRHKNVHFVGNLEVNTSDLPVEESDLTQKGGFFGFGGRKVFTSLATLTMDVHSADLTFMFLKNDKCYGEYTLNMS